MTESSSAHDTAAVRLAEIMAAMSIATDIGLGIPIESGLRICFIAMRLTDAIGLNGEDRARTYALALLRHIGCTADSEGFSSMMGDERLTGLTLGPLDQGHPASVLRAAVGLVHAQFPGTKFPPALARLLKGVPRLPEQSRARCEVAVLLADRFGLGPDVQQDLLSYGERWDGKGFGKIKAEDVPISVRVVQVAEGITAVMNAWGADRIDEILEQRRGSAYAPDVVDAALGDRARWQIPDETSVWGDVIEADPNARAPLSGDALDAAMHALGEFADLKSSYLVGHSAGVAALARAAAGCAGLPPALVGLVFRAALAHDVGRVGVSASIWGKKGTLSPDQWEQVRLHAYYTDRVLARPDSMAGIAAVASAHHERLDASGYFRGLAAGQLSMPARILAAADAFRAMIEARPYRPALSPEQAAAELREGVRNGRFDADAVEAVVEAAGLPAAKRTPRPGTLTPREAEVLALVARGRSIKQIAQALVIAPKTVDAHIQHIYTKVGVSTRAAATVWAMQHDLVD